MGGAKWRPEKMSGRGPEVGAEGGPRGVPEGGGFEVGPKAGPEGGPEGVWKGDHKGGSRRGGPHRIGSPPDCSRRWTPEGGYNEIFKNL